MATNGEGKRLNMFRWLRRFRGLPTSTLYLLNSIALKLLNPYDNSCILVPFIRAH